MFCRVNLSWAACLGYERCSSKARELHSAAFGKAEPCIGAWQQSRSHATAMYIQYVQPGLSNKIIEFTSASRPAHGLHRTALDRVFSYAYTYLCSHLRAIRTSKEYLIRYIPKYCVRDTGYMPSDSLLHRKPPFCVKYLPAYPAKEEREACVFTIACIGINGT
nr:hypothetical protein CFP56_02673 [Quercus suber]